MSDPKPRPAASSIVRARFAVAPKIGGEELQAWHADRHKRHRCEAAQPGLVFTLVEGGDEDIETIVPWPNVVSYDRARRS